MVFSSKETIYTPQSDLQTPVYLFKNLFYDLRYSSELALQLAVRDIRSRYRNSFLGVLWSLAGPVGTALTFALLQQQAILNVDTGDIPYPIFVMIGTLLWSIFTSSLQSTLSEVKSALSIMTKINLPREAFLISAILKLLFDLIWKFIPLVFLFLFYQQPLPSTAPLIIVSIINLILLGMVIALFLLPFVMLIDDLQRLLQVVLSFGLFVTPVIYPPTSEGILGFIARFNPVSIPLISGREALVDGTISQLPPFLIMLPILIVMSFFGLIIYRISMPFIIERQSS